MSKSSAPFARCAEASGLVTRDLIKQATESLRADGVESDDRALADKLVALGHLNTWQASQLMQGRTKFTLGPYRILDSLGQGGMGQVFKAEHSMLHIVRAIKVLPAAKSTPHAIAGFEQEIRSQARLEHKHLVRAIDAGRDGGVHYLVSEYVPGCDLRKLVKRKGPLDPRKAAEIAAQVADALQHAHDQGILHRDVKPSNVLVTPEGDAKLTDLGLAGPLGDRVEEDARYGKIVGSADYIAPDHVLSPTTPTPLWDVYSLGCTLYFATTGRPPFQHRESMIESAKAHLRETAPDPRELNEKIDAPLAAVILSMMAKASEQRPQTAGEVRDLLRSWLARQERRDAGDGSRHEDDAAFDAFVRSHRRLLPNRGLPFDPKIAALLLGFCLIPIAFTTLLVAIGLLLWMLW